jgi:hypothetical protein
MILANLWCYRLQSNIRGQTTSPAGARRCRDFFDLLYNCYWVIFPSENSILFSQSTGKNSKLKVTK